MCQTSLETMVEKPDLRSRIAMDSGVSAPLITYVDPVEISKIDCGTRSASRKRVKKGCHRCRKKRGKAVSARARRQRRRAISQLDALPIARRARAAGLHGAALRAYIAAVEALDGPAALTE